MIGRRSFLRGASALLTAPAIVRADSLMALPLGHPLIDLQVETDEYGRGLVTARCRVAGVSLGLGYALDHNLGKLRRDRMNAALIRSMQQAIDIVRNPYRYAPETRAAIGLAA